MTLRELLARAKSAGDLAPPVRYRLGAGGMDPRSATPANHDGFCDCSGFVCWCLGLSRKTDHPAYVAFNGGWINTDALKRDGELPTGFFDRLDVPIGQAPVGSLLVYGRQGATVGHVGLVVTPGQVCHCSAGNFRRTGHAIATTPPTIWQARVAQVSILWYAGIVA